MSDQTRIWDETLKLTYLLLHFVGIKEEDYEKLPLYPLGLNLREHLKPIIKLIPEKEQVTTLLEERVNHLVKTDKGGNDEEEKLINYTKKVVNVLYNSTIELLNLFYKEIPTLIRLGQSILSSLRENYYLGEDYFTDENSRDYTMKFLEMVSEFFTTDDEVVYPLMGKILLPLYFTNVKVEEKTNSLKPSEILVQGVKPIKNTYSKIADETMEKIVDEEIKEAIKNSVGIVSGILDSNNGLITKQVSYLYSIISLFKYKLYAFTEEELNKVYKVVLNKWNKNFSSLKNKQILTYEEFKDITEELFFHQIKRLESYLSSRNKLIMDKYNEFNRKALEENLIKLLLLPFNNNKTGGVGNGARA